MSSLLNRKLNSVFPTEEFDPADKFIQEMTVGDYLWNLRTQLEGIDLSCEEAKNSYLSDFENESNMNEILAEIEFIEECLMK